MNDRMGRALVGGLFGAIPGWILGMEIADVAAGVIEPMVQRLKAAKATGHPGFRHVGAIWHHWTAHHGYLPTHWLPVFHHPHLVLGVLGLGVLTGSFIAYQSAKASGISFWGGPKAAGKGQYGTAHWRHPRTLSKSYTRWQAPVERKKRSLKRNRRALKSVDTLRQEASDLHKLWEKHGKKGPEPGMPPVGLLVGADSLNNPLAGWILTRDEHALVMSKTRSGKTRRLIIPTIAIIGSVGTESMVLTDPKAELYDHTAAWLESRGYEVIRIDLIEPALKTSDRFNPIASVYDALHQPTPDWARAADVARQVAHIITFGGGGNLINTDPLWINGQIALTSAMILAVAERAEDVSECHLASTYRLLLSAGEDEGKTLDTFLATFPAGHPAQLAYGTYRLAQGKTRASIITTAAAGLQLWGDPRVAWVTAEQNHDIRRVAERPTAVFLIVPDEDKTRHPVAALYINQLFIALTRFARQHGGRLPVRVNFLLDEFGNMPAFPDFDSTVTVAAGRGMRLVLVLQNLEQLRTKYERTERTIRGNLGTWLYLLTSDLQTAEELSKMIGRYTLNSESAQMPKVGWTTMTTNVGHTSQGISLTGRELVTPDELMRWPMDQVLCWQAGYPPAQLPLPDLSKWTIFADLQQPHRGGLGDPKPVPTVPVFTITRQSAPAPIRPPSPPRSMADAQAVWNQRLPAAPTPSQEGKGGDAAMVDIPINAMGGLANLFTGQRAPIEPDDVPDDSAVGLAPI